MGKNIRLDDEMNGNSMVFDYNYCPFVVNIV